MLRLQSKKRHDGAHRHTYRGSRKTISVLCLISGLEHGGTEVMLYRFLSGMDRTRFSAQVISMIGAGPYSNRIQELGVPLWSLGMQRGIPNPMGIVRLVRWLREARPDVIQTWMYHADLLGGVAAKLAGNIPVAWGVHQSDMSREGNGWLTLRTIALCSRMSPWLPSRVICSSEASRQVHVSAGYSAKKMMVIPNGFDLEIFKPNPAARRSVRKQLEIPDEAPLVGLLARFHPQKDHRNFVEAAGLLSRMRPDVHFLLCGDGVTPDNAELLQMLQKADILGRCRVLGNRDDVPFLLASLDIVASSSFAESFPVVIGEAMSCEIPCVVTDVGDSALIVGQTGRSVPPRDPKALAFGLHGLIQLGREGRQGLGKAARQRIRAHYDLPDIVRQYENVYEELASGMRS